MRLLLLVITFVSSFLVYGWVGHAKHAPAASLSAQASAAKTIVLATIAQDDKPQVTIHHGQRSSAPASRNTYNIIFSDSGTGVAYVVQKGGKYLVVHNNNRGREYESVGAIALSIDGRRVAYPALAKGIWRMVVDGREEKSYDAMLPPVFSPDGRHVAYRARRGDTWHVVIDGLESAGTTGSFTDPEFNADASRIAYVEATPPYSTLRLIISDLTFRNQTVKEGIGDLLFVVNRDRTRIVAAQDVGNKPRIIDFDFNDPRNGHEGPLYDLIDKLTFGEDGKSVCYCALQNGRRLIILNNKKETLPPGQLPQLPVVRPDGRGAGVLLVSNNRYYFHQAFVGRQTPDKWYDETADLAYSRDSRSYAFAARRGAKWFVVANGKEGPAFDRVAAPVFSPVGRKIAYRAWKNGKQFMVISSTAGRTINQLTAYEQVFKPVFGLDGKSIAYNAQDGHKLIQRIEGI